MTTKLERELQTYVSFLDTLVPTTSAVQLEQTPEISSTSRWQRKGWPVAAMAAAAAMILVGSVAWVFGPGSTTETGPLSASGWSRISDDEALLGDSMWGVTAGGPGFMAIGRAGLGYPGVWTSVDGRTWSQVTDDESAFSRRQYVWDVTVGGPGLVAVGTANDRQAVVWTSADGLDWSRVPHDEEVFGGGRIQVMLSVTAGGPGLVAVGTAQDGGPEHGAVWTSTDGLGWSRVSHDNEVFGGPRRMNSVIAAGPGLVAVGEADGDAAVWTSVDGLEWSRVPHDGEIFGGPDNQGMNSVSVGGPGLVAVGSEGLGGHKGPIVWSNAVVWTSPDGLVWSRVRNQPDLEGESFLQMSDVAVVGAELVAIGSDEGPDDGDAAVWTSTDGVTWSRVPHDEAVFGGEGFQTMNRIAVMGSRVVAVGWDESEDESSIEAAIWVLTN